MRYIISYTSEALEHLAFWRKSGQKKVAMKIMKLIDELSEHPETGTGKPERLKGDMSGLWSRKIDKKNRLVYSIEDDRVVVEIV